RSRPRPRPRLRLGRVGGGPSRGLPRRGPMNAQALRMAPRGTSSAASYREKARRAHGRGVHRAKSSEDIMATQVNGIDLDTLSQTIEAIKGDPNLAQCKFRATNRWTGSTRNVGRVEGFYAAKQEM